MSFGWLRPTNLIAKDRALRRAIQFLKSPGAFLCNITWDGAGGMQRGNLELQCRIAYSLPIPGDGIFHKEYGYGVALEIINGNRVRAWFMYQEEPNRQRIVPLKDCRKSEKP
jgi:hypothetical protein